MNWEGIKREAKEIGKQIMEKTGKMMVTGVLITAMAEITKRVTQWVEMENEEQSEESEDTEEILPEQPDEE